MRLFQQEVRKRLIFRSYLKCYNVYEWSRSRRANVDVAAPRELLPNIGKARISWYDGAFDGPTLFGGSHYAPSNSWRSTMLWVFGSQNVEHNNLKLGWSRNVCRFELGSRRREDVYFPSPKAEHFRIATCLDGLIPPWDGRFQGRGLIPKWTSEPRVAERRLGIRTGSIVICGAVFSSSPATRIQSPTRQHDKAPLWVYGSTFSFCLHTILNTHTEEGDNDPSLCSSHRHRRILANLEPDGATPRTPHRYNIFLFPSSTCQCESLVPRACEENL